MPSEYTYPGVYIEEIPSGVRTIVGVSTSITAFVGRTVRGPIGATDINSYGDFERLFGDLDTDYPISFAVNDFFLNGGSRAVIVRLARQLTDQEEEQQPVVSALIDAIKASADAASAKVDITAAVTAINNDVNASAEAKAKADALKAEIDQPAYDTLDKIKDYLQSQVIDVADTATMMVGGLALRASSPGRWGNNLRVSVNNTGIDGQVASRYGVPAGDLFNLTVEEVVNKEVVRSEQFRNLYWKGANHARSFNNVLEQQSLLVRMEGQNFPAVNPVDTLAAEKALEEAAAAAVGDPAKAAADGAAAKVAAKTASDAIQSDANKSALEKAAAAAVLAAVDALSDTAIPTDIGKAVNAALDAIKSSTARSASGGDNGSGLEVPDYQGDGETTGIYSLADSDFNLMCIPPDVLDSNTKRQIYTEALAYCAQRRAFLIVDPDIEWGQFKDSAVSEAQDGLNDMVSQGLAGPGARNAMLYFPRVRKADPTSENQIKVFPACGIVAGLMARTDATRGVWKAPAGIDAALLGIVGPQVLLNDRENGGLNPRGINVVRNFPIIGNVMWGSRTMRGADQLADEYKYVPVRRLALYIEESLYRGTKWIVFEPNDEPLWAQIRLNIGAFMQDLFRQGAFQGKSPRDAYFVKCDHETTTQYDIDRGVVNIVVGFAPLKPAEFVVIKLQQIAQTQV